MWLLCHRLFGWDYVYWCGVKRLQFDKLGRLYIRSYSHWYFIVEVYSKNQPTEHQLCFSEIIWLTCKPEKYLREKER